METDFQNLLIQITKILKRLKILYVVTGGYAVSVWGRPRATFDIDIIIELFKPKIDELVKALRKISPLGYIDENMILEAFEKKGEFNFIDGESGIKIDFWIIGDDPIAKNEILRRIPKKINNQIIYFISPEDLILSKLNWHKKGGSVRHLEDIESIFKISKVDIKYIKKWAKQQSTSEILKEVLKNVKS